MQKSFSYKRFLATRSSKLDPMLICFDNFFLGQKLPRMGYISYQAYSVHVTVLFSHKLSGLYFSNKYFPLVKVTTVFVHVLLGQKLPSVGYATYRASLT